MKILYLSRYTKSGASSRYRIYQYYPFLKSQGVDIEAVSLFTGGIADKNVWLLIKQYLKRIYYIIKTDADIIYIEKEIFPYFYDFLPGNKKVIIDFDDAIFHNYDNSKSKILKFIFRNKIPKLINKSNVIISGSPYLTSFCQQFNPNVFEIPTSINFETYKSRKVLKENNKFIVGWIGSKSTSIQLLMIKDVIIRFSQDFDCEFHLVGFDKDLANEFLHCKNVKIIKWDSNIEVELICQFSCGIMPLYNGKFQNGKCGFKLIQYMACGLPTISTPLEANIKINRNNGNLFANNEVEWYQNLKEIMNNDQKYSIIGKRNLQIVEDFYSIEQNGKKYLEIFKSLLNV